MSLGLTSLLAVGSSADVYAADTTAIEVSVTYGQSEARKLTDMVNSFRTGSDNWYWNSTDNEKLYATGLSNLSWDYDLEKVAMQRAAEIALSLILDQMEHCAIVLLQKQDILITILVKIWQQVNQRLKQLLLHGWKKMITIADKDIVVIC